MKVKYLFGKRAGEICHVPRSQEIDVLLGAGIIEEVPLTEHERIELQQASGHTVLIPVRTPEWSVIRHRESRNILVVRKSGFETTYFDGVPDPAKWSDLSPARAKELKQQFEEMRAHDEAQARANLAERQRA